MIADLSGLTALVTGAASGIGRATAACLVAQGAVVHATDLNDAGLSELVDQLGADNVVPHRLDVTDRQATVDTVASVVETSGRLDILVCSAGIVLASDDERASSPSADWDRCMAVNLHGTIHACEAATPHLAAAPDGAIVTIGSISAHSSRQSGGAYPVSKAAALRYTKSLALTLAPSVRVNAVCPGAVWTGMQARIASEIQRFTNAEAPDDEQTFFARYADITPMKRPQTPDDVARAVTFLASPDAANITGQCLHVDGGTVIRD